MLITHVFAYFDCSFHQDCFLFIICALFKTKHKSFIFFPLKHSFPLIYDKNKEQSFQVPEDKNQEIFIKKYGDYFKCSVCFFKCKH